MIHFFKETLTIGLEALGVEVDERGAKKIANYFVVKTPKPPIVKYFFFSRTILENSFLEKNPESPGHLKAKFPWRKRVLDGVEPLINSSFSKYPLFSVPACPLTLKVLNSRGKCLRYTVKGRKPAYKIIYTVWLNIKYAGKNYKEIHQNIEWLWLFLSDSIN